ncbi:ABC transporter permease [Cypionkella sp.]|uniref:ABC transporter permease n=1 Tax=Cypionkella sp. TaxID=2811411 RepID=UPI0027435A70|nr:ABC transporter permease [Cypionkella sp.]
MTPRQPASIRQEGKVFPIAFAKGFITIVAATLILVVLCLVFAPSSVSSGALAGSLPFASMLAIVGLGQMLVVQQGGFDLSVAGGVSLSVVLVTHYPAGDDAQLLPAILIALGCALLIGVCNSLLVGYMRLNAIVATIGVNALIYGGVFAVSGGVPRITTDLLATIAGGSLFGIGNAVVFAAVALGVVALIMKKTVMGRRFEAVGASPALAATIGLPVRRYQMLAYVFAQLLYCLAGILIAGLTTQPTAFQGDPLLLPSVAVVVLGGTSLLGGRGFPVSTVIAALFLNQLSQFSYAVGVPYSAQTIIQALALGFGIGIHSIRLPNKNKKLSTHSNLEETNETYVS